MESKYTRHALSRGGFHAVIGLVVAIALLLLPRLLVLIALAIITVAFLSFEAARLRIPPLRQWFSTWFGFVMRPEEEKKLTGSSYLLIGCLITALAFPQNMASLAILFLSLGDPVAAVIGMWRGHTNLWGKSVEGSLACLTTCILVGALFTTILKNPPFIIALVGAIFAALFQALPIRIDDNFTIPLGSAGAMLLTSITQSCFCN